MFSNFGDYMFDLLFSPLKKVKKSLNQFYIFFKVIGKRFDAAKQEIFRVRQESSIVTASEAMLQVHGADRDMVRLQGETIDGYRTRLAMRAIIAEEAGSNEGIRYLARAFGYDNVEITPGVKPDKWAEATVLFIGGKIVLDDQALLLQELNKIKPARTLLTLAKEQRYSGTIHVATAYIIGKELTMRQG